MLKRSECVSFLLYNKFIDLINMDLWEICVSVVEDEVLMDKIILMKN